MRRICSKWVLCFLLVIVFSPQGGAEESGAALLEQFTEGAKGENVLWLLGFYVASEEGKLVLMAGYREWRLRPAKGISLKGLMRGDLLEVGIVPSGDGYELVAVINHKLPDERQWAIIQ
ncbi:MAG: hypothetical protein N2Z76_08400, partial [Treponemataceae bacterium]|nr:hypothetical protein [Treponemataceae bacterium]